MSVCLFLLLLPLFLASLSNALVNPEEPLVEGYLLLLGKLEELSTVDLSSKLGVLLTLDDLD